MEESVYLEEQLVAPLNVHRPDPDSPRGMAWVLGVGMVDPRPGMHPNQPMALTQSWEPTSELWWKLGMRWHPELATVWARGGGQFEVAEILEEKPDDEGDFSLEQGAEEILEHLGEEHPEYAAMLREIRSAGTQEERIKLVKGYQGEINKLLQLIKYISEQPKE